MKNRAKCKLCNSIIESFHRYDHVTCKCGEISVDGGTDEMRSYVKNWNNFLRIDDNGNEIIVQVKDVKEPITDMPKHKPTKKELMEMLEDMIKSYDNLPAHAMQAPVTNYDLSACLLLILSIFRED